MQMDSRLPLMGQGIDVIGNMARGQQAAQFANDARHQNAFRAMLQEQGPGIMQGDGNALSSYARFDPIAALGVQQTRQNMSHADERMQMARTAAARQAAAWAQQQDAATLASTREQVERGLAMATQAQTPEQWDAIFTDLAPQYVGQFDNRQMIFAGAMGLRDALEMAQAPSAGFRPATQEEAAQYGAAGGQFGPDGRFYAINPPSGMTVETTPDGGLRLVQGSGVGSRADRAEEVAEQNRQDAAATVLADIDRVLALEDDAIIPVTGAVGRIASGIPGTAAHDVSALLDTIGANIAFDALNQMRAASPTGGALGQVTERELALLQATAGSLRQSQSPTQFRRNLQRLREQFAAIVHGPQAGQSPSVDMSPSQTPEQGGPARPSGAQQRSTSVPDEAVRMLLDDPSPEAQREFDEVFGAGEAARLLRAMQ